MTESWRQWEGRVVNGEFRLGRYLGGSDHSAVFLTERRQPQGQPAAIKLTATDASKAEHQLLRWQKTSSLSHPHLLRIFEAGRCRLDNVSLVYVVMEYAEEDLSQIIPQRPLTPAEARDVLSAVLNALAYLHDKGFVHGHLKPADIMAVGDTIKLSSDAVSPAGDLNIDPGKVSAYAPPEGTSSGVFPAADVWSLGVTLIEILTQGLPVQSGSEPEERVLPQMPEPFMEVARHCLQRDPQNRWTAADIAERLQPAPRRTLQAAIAAPRPAFVKWGYVSAIVVAVLAVAAMLAVPRIRDRRPETPPATPVASAPAVPAPQPSTTPARTRTGHKPVAPAVSSSPSSPVPAKKTTLQPTSREIVQQVLPDVPRSAANTIQGTVRVRVKVTLDPSGSVSHASFASPGPSKYFANLAMQAARKWKFASGQVDVRNVPSEWILQFEFRRNGTKASAAPAG
jgi:TonB family protein